MVVAVFAALALIGMAGSTISVNTWPWGAASAGIEKTREPGRLVAVTSTGVAAAVSSAEVCRCTMMRVM